MNHEQYERYLDRYLSAKDDSERAHVVGPLRVLARFCISGVKQEMGITYNPSSRFNYIKPATLEGS